MEGLSNHLKFSTSPPFTPKFFTTSRNSRNPYIFRIPISKFLKRPSFPRYLLLSNTRSLQVSAHFGRPTSRRNSLRKKLVNDPEVHIENPSSLNPSPDFKNTETLDINDGVENGDIATGSVDDGVFEKIRVEESNLKSVGESAMLSKLENWVDQYKKDAEYWGIGSDPIFTIFQDVEGNVKKVLVNENEISKRIQVKKNGFGNLAELKSRIMYAKSLAREMEIGKNGIPRNSSVAKFVVSDEESGFVNGIRGFISCPEFIPKISRVGRGVLFGLVVFWVIKKFFAFGKGNKNVEYTELEKEMMRRKIKSRKEKELLEKKKVEVVEDVREPRPVMVSIERPKIDKKELMKNIVKAKALKDKSGLVDISGYEVSESKSFDNKIDEIRAMARRAREIEGKEQSQINVNEELEEDDVGFWEDGSGINGSEVKTSSVEAKGQDLEFSRKVASVGNVVKEALQESKIEAFEDLRSRSEDSENNLHKSKKEVNQPSDILGDESFISEANSVKTKPRIIRSVKEAREFLNKKGDKQKFQHDVNKDFQNGATFSQQLSDTESDTSTNEILDWDNKNGYQTYSDEGYGVADYQKSQNSSDRAGIAVNMKMSSSVKTDNWMENNFQDIEPVFKKMGDGFRDNFKVAKEKANQQVDTYADITKLGSIEDDSELEWMKDDRLREIVFQVRDNELAGRDPFYLMDAEDKRAFLEGLEKKVEKENEKLSHLHEWLHSNIENLDYGADGISIYDPPEKIIPRWKGPPLEKNPEFLDYFREQRESVFSGTTDALYPMKKNKENSLQRPTENDATSLATSDLKSSQNQGPKSSKTIIEGSDGSVKPGKKSGKEFWQHTKKWSREFLECYNAETDPEVKSVMKDMGKDLDRWITEEEVEEAADLMNKLSERNKKFMEKKLNKLKREMELFGPQAVVSKYREYAEDKEEDYLWWLDLPHVLCIELYTIDDGEQRMGFYSLEMAEDLELEPKPCHVIAFEDAVDCKNMCYIIQAHLEMLGNGNAFVVARPPKDAFREAKANGFGVTVIRKGELSLNVDQTLEEVEEQIAEIGSKVYHDQIMKERSVDMSSLMKGVLGVNGKPTMRKKTKRLLKRLSKKRK